MSKVKLLTSVGTRTREEAAPPIVPAACTQIKNNIITKIRKEMSLTVLI